MNSENPNTVEAPGVGAKNNDAVSVPWQLKVVAFLFILFGTYAAFAMIAGLFHDSFYLRLDVFFLLLGFGLLKLKKGFLSCAGTLLILGLISAGLTTVLLAVFRKNSYLRIEGVAFARLPWYASVLLAAGMFLLFWWMIRVLDRQKTSEVSAHYPRGTAWIVTGAIIAALALGGMGEYVHWRANPEMVSSITPNQQGVWMVSYACVFDDLSYAVFQHALQGESVSWAVTKSGIGNNRKAWLKMPDGTEKPLPGDHRLYEFNNGELLTSDEPITRKEFEAFMASHPDEYTIYALLKFVGKTPLDTP